MDMNNKSLSIPGSPRAQCAPSVFTPASLAGLVQWSEDSSLANGVVPSWPDLSGNGNAWIQATLSKQPVKSASGVLLDGVNDLMTCNALAPVFAGKDGQYTAFFVAQPTALTGSRTLLGLGSLTNLIPTIGHRLISGKSSFTRRGDANESVNIAYTGLITESSGLATYTYRHRLNQTGIWIKGIVRQSEIPQPEISAMTLDQVALGGLKRTTESLWWLGYIRATIIYNRALSELEREQVEAYLCGLYSLDQTAEPLNTTERIVDLFHSWWAIPNTVVVGRDIYSAGVTNLGVMAVGRLGPGGPDRLSIEALAQPDDHNGPAILHVPGKVPIVFTAEHNAGDSMIHWRKGTVVDDFTTLSPMKKSIVVTGRPNYPQPFNVPGTDNGLLFFRDATFSWSFFKTSDYFETLSAKTKLISFGGTNQGYCQTIQLADGTLRIAAYGHPLLSTLHDVYYCAIDLVSGNVTKVNGTVIGNVNTGANLPLAMTALDKIYITPAAPAGTRLFDISDGPVIEVGIGTWTSDTDMHYKYITWNGTSWGIKDITAAGIVFGEQPTAHYNGGMSFQKSTSGGVLYLSKENAGTWTIEKWVTTDGGNTWTTTVLATAAAGHKYIRPYGLAATDPFQLTYLDCTNYGGYVHQAYLTFQGDTVALAEP
jgi:hypothetical protein